MNPTPRSPREALRAFLAETGTAVSPAEIRGDTPLVESGLLSSLQVADLLLLLEELRGRPLDLGALGPGSFKDLDTIIATFLEDDT